MREGQLGSKLAAHLRDRNAMVIPQVVAKHGAVAYSQRGVSDKYVCHTYWRGWMELKRHGETMTQEQLDFIKMVVERGDNACCVTFNNPKHEWDGDYTSLTVCYFDPEGFCNWLCTASTLIGTLQHLLTSCYHGNLAMSKWSEYPVSMVKK